MGEEEPRVLRLKRVDRSQGQLRPVVVEELIEEDHPARAIWEFVGRLDLTRFVEEVQSVEGEAGRPAYDPQLLISLWVYSYSRGVSSARAVERLCGHDPAFQWLTGMEVVGAHTLSDFRVKHGEALQDLFIQVLGLLSAEGLITMERVMHDGTRIRASASSSQFHRRTWVEECLEQARKTVETLDTVAEEVLTRQKQRARERAIREKEERLSSALTQFEKLKASKSRVERVSVTDPESRLMKQPEGGTAPSYNVQVSTDAANALIVGIEATQAGSDYRQLTPAMDRLEQTLEQKPEQVVADGGYISNENIVAMADRGIELIGPKPKGKEQEGNRQKSYRHRGVSPDYEGSRFQYEPTTDTYLCPLGKTLTYDAKYPSAGAMHYRYRAAVEDCQACPAKRLCCPRTRHGRSVERIESLPAITAFRERVQTPEAQAVYRTRSRVAEFPNLWIKDKLGVRRFRVRGLAKVRLECLWAALTYDIQNWIRLLWRPRALALA